jgi:hypothetical protein
MADIKIDPTTGDIDFSNNGLAVTDEGLESIAQMLRIRLRTFYREWILNRSVGTKWFELVLRKDIEKFAADQEIRGIILDTPKIQRISEWESTIEDNNYSVVATVTTTTGETLTFGFSDILNTILS